MESRMISTTFTLPGYDVVESLGEVMGLTVRSRNAFSTFGSGLKSMFGGELKGQTRALYDSRKQVLDRMADEAEQRGGNAVLGMRFDASEIGSGWTEICAYGTAVRVVPAGGDEGQAPPPRPRPVRTPAPGPRETDPGTVVTRRPRPRP